MNEDLKTPYELFGIECGKGWKSLYQPILDRIEEINKDTSSNITPTQIKEKFGRLDINLSEYNDELLGMIQDVSEKSSHICEECGVPAESFEKNGWVYTLCDECYNKFIEKTEWLLENEKKD